MLHRTLLWSLFVAAAILLLLSAVAIPGGDLLYSVLAVAYPVALIAVGARRGGRLRPLAPALVLLLLCLVGSVLAMLALRGSVADGGLWILGLPLATTIFIWGIWLLPLVVVSLAYALTFERFTLRDEDLRRLAELRRPGSED